MRRAARADENWSGRFDRAKPSIHLALALVTFLLWYSITDPPRWAGALMFPIQYIFYKTVLP